MNTQDEKLLKNTTVVGFLQMDVVNITLDELKLLNEKEIRLTSSMVFKGDVHKDDPSKRTVVLKSFTYKKGGTQEKLGIRSTVEFHFEAGLWIPRKLELQIDTKEPKIFSCDVAREPEGFRYSYEVKEMPKGK